MADEADLIRLLDEIGDHAPSVRDTLDRLVLPLEPGGPAHRRWVPIAGAATAVAASAVLALSLVGTANHDRPTSGATGTPTVDRATYSLPLDAYHASNTQQRTLQRAEFELARRCAQAHGVAVPEAVLPAGNEAAQFMSTVANNIRPLTLRQARTIGYQMYPSGGSAIDVALAGLTPQQLEVFEGWNSSSGLPKPDSLFLLEGGCSGPADRALLKGAQPAHVPGQRQLNGQPGLFDDDTYVENVYLNEADPGGFTPAVQRAQKTWSTCMAEHGYRGLRNTGDAIVGSTKLSAAAAEKEAVQDVGCKQSTGFLPVWVAAMAKAQNAVIAAHQPQLALFKKRLATRMANAAKALN